MAFAAQKKPLRLPDPSQDRWIPHVRLARHGGSFAIPVHVSVKPGKISFHVTTAFTKHVADSLSDIQI